MRKAFAFILTVCMMLICSPGWAVDYYPSPSCTNQAATTAGCTGAFLSAAGTSKQVTIKYRHVSGGDTTAYTVTADMSITANVKVVVEPGAVLTIATAKTLTINGTMDAGGYQIFSGAGAVSGLKESRPEWFAVNTSPGTTNMTAAWNNAGLAVVSGGTIKGQDGTNYYINTAGGVTVTNPVRITGKFTMTTGSTVGNAPTLTVAGNASVLENFAVTGYIRPTFDGSEAVNVNLRRAILVTGDNVSVSHVSVADAEYGIEFNDADGSEISGCTFTNATIKGGAAMQANSSAVLVTSSDNVKVHDNTIQGYSQGILVGSVCYRTHIHHNSITDTDNNGVYISSGHQATVDHNTIYNLDDNFIKVRGSDHTVSHNVLTSDAASGSTLGVALTGNGTPDADDWNGWNLVAQGNNIRGDFDYGIAVDDQDAGFVKTFDISGNIIEFSGSSTVKRGISADALQSDGARITNNTIAGHIFGIRATGDATHTHLNMTIDGNVCPVGTDSGITLAYVSQSKVSNNVSKNHATLKAGINMNNVTKTTFTNNDCGDDQAVATLSYGITEGAGSSENKYIHNTTKGAVTYRVKITAAAGAQILTDETIVAELADTYTFLPGQARKYLLDPGGAHRNISPGASGTYGPFPEGYEVIVVNTAGAAENLIFDPSGINVTVGQNKRAIFMFTGTAWTQITAVGP